MYHPSPRDPPDILLLSLVLSLPISVVIVLVSDLLIDPGLGRDILGVIATYLADLVTVVLLKRISTAENKDH